MRWKPRTPSHVGPVFEATGRKRTFPFQPHLAPHHAFEPPLCFQNTFFYPFTPSPQPHKAGTARVVSSHSMDGQTEAQSGNGPAIPQPAMEGPGLEWSQAFPLCVRQAARVCGDIPQPTGESQLGENKPSAGQSVPRR